MLSLSSSEQLWVECSSNAEPLYHQIEQKMHIAPLQVVFCKPASFRHIPPAGYTSEAIERPASVVKATNVAIPTCHCSKAAFLLRVGKRTSWRQ